METRKRKNQELLVIIENDIVVPNIKKEPINYKEPKPLIKPCSIMETINIEDKHQIAIIENNIDVTNVKLEPTDMNTNVDNQENLVTDDMMIANIKQEPDIEETLENVYDNQIEIVENSLTVDIKEEPSEICHEIETATANIEEENATVIIKQEKDALTTDSQMEVSVPYNVSLDQSDNKLVTVKPEIKQENLTDFTENVIVTMETLVLIDCPHCPKKFLSEEIFQTHYKEEHLLNCLQCKKTYMITYCRNNDLQLCINCRSNRVKVEKERCKLCGFECKCSFMMRHFEVVHKIFDKQKRASLCEAIECYY